VGELFWALDDVNFEVKQGEILGIIGRNGAGKSTLLKILSQVTSPTSGEIKVRGRIASLLEVGTGFHPELTGRENIFLNGAILGMTKAEIRKRFEEIVEFSECAAFIDTPVKRYSSGMYVRLAFVVAAHLEPEILVVDEVLAVGDAQFQKKCLGKMQDVGRQGRTVLFVSHTMSAVTRLCTRAIMMADGHLLKEGAVHNVVSTYLHSGLGTTTARVWSELEKAPGDDAVKFAAVRVRGDHSYISGAVDIRTRVGIEIEFEVLREGVVMVPSIHIVNDEGICVCIVHDWESEWRDRARPVGRHRSTCWIPGNFLAEGTFIVGVALATYLPFQRRAWEPEAVAFEVIDTMNGDSARGDWAGAFPGIVRPLLPWTNEFEGTTIGLSTPLPSAAAARAQRS
jgi:lipopolysaccharide transport system ATP-binding protein